MELGKLMRFCENNFDVPKNPQAPWNLSPDELLLLDKQNDKCIDKHNKNKKSILSLCLIGFATGFLTGGLSTYLIKIN